MWLHISSVMLQVGVVIVEEAAETQECHVLASLSPHTQHLIMVGDHKQLRPKCDSYNLTVESGSGHTLNISMFERQVLAGFPHASLTTQHRMIPQISQLIQPTYPLLTDHPSVHLHPAVLGLTKNVVFIDHRYEEGSRNMSGMESQDQGDFQSRSKVNVKEVQMVAPIVQYLLQQGYRSEQMVVLTPYKSQVTLIREALSWNKGADLAVSGPGQQSVRVETIDNFQGGFRHKKLSHQPKLWVTRVHLGGQTCGSGTTKPLLGSF